MGWESLQKESKQVEIEQDFELAAYTVTQEQWEAAMGKNPSWFSRQGTGRYLVEQISDADLKRFPVENVSLSDVEEFLDKLNEREKGKGWLYRLPTEAEWEYACRGAATSKEECSFDFYFLKPTNDLSSKRANFAGLYPAGKAEPGPNLGRTTKVGSYAPNKLGLYDMNGNVHQWCEGRSDASVPGPAWRGGSWSDIGFYCSAAPRRNVTASSSNTDKGVRVARMPFGVKPQPLVKAEPAVKMELPIKTELPMKTEPGIKAEPAIKASLDLASMQFVHLPKATFWMGWDSFAKQAKQVEIQQDFELAAYTVTQEQWQAVMGNNPSSFSRQGVDKDKVERVSDADLKRFPVENVSFNDVKEFLDKLNEREKGKGWLYRLPKEAEWEYACRGGATSMEECSFDFYLERPTNNLSSKQANFDGTNPAGNAEKGRDLGRTTKVGSYEANKLGLYDMHGNVYQWCDDPFEGKGPARVVRGGSWDSDGLECQAAGRAEGAVGNRDNDLGFRLARVRTGSK